MATSLESPQSKKKKKKKRVQQAEEGLPYLHLTYFILWESSILKGKEREKNCWGGLLAAGWTAVFKDRDKWEISPESTQRVNLVVLSFHETKFFHFEMVFSNMFWFNNLFLILWH